MTRLSNARHFCNNTQHTDSTNIIEYYSRVTMTQLPNLSSRWFHIVLCQPPNAKKKMYNNFRHRNCEINTTCYLARRIKSTKSAIKTNFPDICSIINIPMNFFLYLRVRIKSNFTDSHNALCLY